jgi:hypothetical protein
MLRGETRVRSCKHQTVAVGAVAASLLWLVLCLIPAATSTASAQPQAQPSPQSSAQPSPQPSAQLSSVAGADFDGCPVTGIGGDPALNTQKNRSATPPADLVPYTVTQLAQLPPVDAADGVTRSAWPASDQSAVAGREQQAVVLTAYIVRAIAEGKEACNCDSLNPNDHDVHLYVGDIPDDTPANAAIVEVTPRWRAAYPSWNAQNLQKLADSGTQVRITGWLMYDQEHWDMIAKHERATLWEVHPVTSIQVETSQGWVDLANYTP